MAPSLDTTREPVLFQGQSVSPGVAYGPLFLTLEGLEELETRRLADDEVDAELARVDSVARAARVSLVHQRKSLGEHFTEEQRRIFDTHLTMLEDPTIEADLRSRIVEDRLSFESALKDMLEVYERLFEVVESSNLRNKLADMRDIALRMLRFSQPASKRPKKDDRKGGILLVRELSLSDLTEALDQGVVGIIAEEGSPESHGAILTRAAGIPAVIGLGQNHQGLDEGCHVLVDGDSGEVHLAPDPETVQAAEGRTPEGGFEVMPPAALLDGTRVSLEAFIASPSEAKQVTAMGIRNIGLYRTELPVMQRQGRPREDSLTVLYGQVLAAADKVCFRLPDLTSAAEIGALYPAHEPNPALGMRGIRLLLQQKELLSTQLRAILRAHEGKPCSMVVPFVVDRDELNRLRSSMDEAREELRLEGVDVPSAPRLGAVLETPAAALLGREWLQAADFAWIGLDVMAEGLLMADRRNAHDEVFQRLRVPHPVLLRAVRKLVTIANSFDKPIGVYGESLVQPGLAALLIGLGVRRFAVRPSILREAHEHLKRMDPDTCERVAEQACRATTAKELRDSLPPSWLS